LGGDALVYSRDDELFSQLGWGRRIMESSKPKILIVEESEGSESEVYLSKDLYDVNEADNLESILKLSNLYSLDLILLDLTMVSLNGYELLEELKFINQVKDIPVILITEKSDENLHKGFELGAVDYVVKPINSILLNARIKNNIIVRQSQNFLKDKNKYLEMEIDRRTKEVALIQEVSIMAMASLAETRDNETGQHILRTKLYVKELANLLSKDEKYKNYLTKETIDLMVASSPLHDIGKVGIPDDILLKAGPLTKEEFEIMKTHTMIGKEAIVRAERILNKPETFLKLAKEIAHYHHEKWNGRGYPEGLAGENIPISARIMAVVDVYDALTSKRVYKEAFSHDESVEIILNDSGMHFDPGVVEAFIQLKDKFKAIGERCRD
jgi:cyclic di-GMP phosphodiesterase